jgi:hypothetical protein
MKKKIKIHLFKYLYCIEIKINSIKGKQERGN